MFVLVEHPSRRSSHFDVINELRNATVTGGAKLADCQKPTTTSFGITATWTLDAGEDWETYVRSVTARLPPGFHAETLTQPVFTRLLQGDSQSLQLERISDAPVLHVRVTFKSYAD